MRKAWLRTLISFFGGAILSELIAVITNEGLRIPILLSAAFIFGIFSLVIYLKKVRSYYFPPRKYQEEEREREEFLKDFKKENK